MSKVSVAVRMVVCVVSVALVVGSVAVQAQSTRPEDNRPPMFFREDWKHPFDNGGEPEGPIGPEHVANPDLELRLYGEAPQGDPTPRPPDDEHTHAHMWMNKRFANDPAHLFTGTCNRPCGLTLRHRSSDVDLSGFGAKIRWLVKVSGFHQVRPLLRLSDGTLLVGDHTDEFTEAFDWSVSEFSIADVRWRRLDPDKVVTATGDLAGWFEPDLSRVEEVGFVDLMPGSSHGNGGFSDVAWIEVYGQPVARN